MKSQYPTIDDRLGGAPPERHAERVTDEMLAWMQKNAPNMRRGEAVIDPGRMGGPRGQRRTMERLRKTLGPLLLAHYLTPGKRGHFKAAWTFWALWDSINETIVRPGEPVPYKAGLAAVFISLEGPGYEPKFASHAVFVASRHACIRLAQRAGVRNVSDLISAMRELWEAVEPLIGECDRELHRPLRPGPDSPIAVFAPHHTFDGLMIVKTILEASMSNAAPTARVLEAA